MERERVGWGSGISDEMSVFEMRMSGVECVLSFTLWIVEIR